MNQETPALNETFVTAESVVRLAVSSIRNDTNSNAITGDARSMRRADRIFPQKEYEDKGSFTAKSTRVIRDESLASVCFPRPPASPQVFTRTSRSEDNIDIDDENDLISFSPVDTVQPKEGKLYQYQYGPLFAGDEDDVPDLILTLDRIWYFYTMRTNLENMRYEGKPHVRRIQAKFYMNACCTALQNEDNPWVTKVIKATMKTCFNVIRG